MLICKNIDKYYLHVSQTFLSRTNPRHAVF